MEFVYGGISGMCQNIIGFPLDTIKVLKQNNMNFKHKNPLRYYNGFSYSVSNQIINNAISFSSLSYLNSYLKNYYISGFLTGIVVSPVVFSFDVGKIKNQVSNNKFYFVDYKDILNTKGKETTVLRESIALSIYFGTYHELRKNNVSIITSGGLAGVLNWLITYPLDIIKTRQMTFQISFKEAFHQKKLFRGLDVCLIRAFLVNSIGFYSYELAKLYINN